MKKNISMIKQFFLILLCSYVNFSFAQSDLSDQIRNATKGSKVVIDTKVSLTKEILIENKEGIEIISENKSEIVTFNNIPYLIKFKNCSDITIKGLKMRYGVKNVGGPLIYLENCKDITLQELELGNNAKNALFIDSLSKNIKIENSDISGCQESGIKTMTVDLEIKNNTFSANSEIGRFKPDIEEIIKNGHPLSRYNKYRVSDYTKHKTTVDEFVALKNSLAYNFDCFKIVKKYNLKDGSEGKLTAFYEGENNKVLDKMQLDYKGSKGQITASIYFLHENLVYSIYEIKKGKSDINYFVYGDFLDHLEKADSKAAAHVAGNPESNRKQFDQWLNTIESWKKYINNPVEEFNQYEFKDDFIALPY